jgi:hypothetical protein
MRLLIVILAALLIPMTTSAGEDEQPRGQKQGQIQLQGQHQSANARARGGSGGRSDVYVGGDRYDSSAFAPSVVVGDPCLKGTSGAGTSVGGGFSAMSHWCRLRYDEQDLRGQGRHEEADEVMESRLALDIRPSGWDGFKANPLAATIDGFTTYLTCPVLGVAPVVQDWFCD